ncbi:proton-dependent oligopeptide transporter, POT family [Mucilaginibacter pineti]|uniref:Proton-dependent oligopeptide transporter, POT family n=1 Tax=Mucilaginibacter pineti TaxID=1391627 RepID=A0A1G6V189_9SPHI|nr:MFS transporter [Mucilaginibacter pineti]SDD46645.1 proton-dependent oligopeptide transporter, POT family [Mucilaginibacter pineti]
MQEKTAAQSRSIGKIPRAVPFIIGNEFAERFSFYGMRSIMVIFMVSQFYLHDSPEIGNAKAYNVYHNFSTLVYATPLLGALLADWFFGKYRVILIGSLIYTIGHFLLSFFDKSLTGFETGLIIIAFSAGAIKSCVSANVGDQFDHSNQHLMSSIYSWFYFSINAGSMVSLFFIPLIYDKFGGAWAFGVPGILMALATLIFFSGRKSYVKLPPRGLNKNNFVFVSIYALKCKLGKMPAGKTAWDCAEVKYGHEKIDAIKAVWRVIAVFAFIPVFWSLWDMNGAEWVVQSQSLDLNLGIFGWKILPAQIQTVNAVFLLAMIPIFNYGLYPLVEKLGIKLTPLRKIGAGLFITGFSFVIIALLQAKIDHGASPSVWWQILAFAVLSAGEVLVSITGLEYAYTQSPPSMKSTMTAIWYITYSVGSFFNAVVTKSIAQNGMFSGFTGASFYWLFVFICLGAFIIFLIISPRLREKAYLASDALANGLDIKGNHTTEIHPDNPIV